MHHRSRGDYRTPRRLKGSFIFAIKTSFYIYIRSQEAETGPPLGTILGNLGVNSISFVNEFNEFTEDLPRYFFLKVHIFILEDRSFYFTVDLPTTGFLLMFIKFKQLSSSSRTDVFFNGVSVKDVIQLALLKFPLVPLKKSLPMLIGTVHSCHLTMVF